MFIRIAVLCLFGIIKSSLSQTICNRTIDINTTELVTTKQNLSFCLDENKEFLSRKFLNVKESEPYCAFLQPKMLSECPDNFTNIDNLCYQLTNSTYPPKCPFKDVVPFEDYKYIADNYNFGPIWVPAKREGLNFMKWTELSWKFKIEVLNYTFSVPLKDKECLIYVNRSFNLVSCHEVHRGICAYKKLNMMSENMNMCSSSFACQQSDYSVKSKCFCLSNNLGLFQFPKVEFVQPYQFYVYRNLTGDVCSISLKMTIGGKHVWTKSLQEINYTYWSPDDNFDEENVYEAITTKGWILTKQLLTCYIFEMDIKILEPSLLLQFNDTEQRFFLMVTNPEKLKTLNSGILVFCFTNAYGFIQPFQYERLTIVRYYNRRKVLYAFYPLNNLSGHYWCEAVKQENLDIISTNQYFIRQNNVLEFVGIFKVRYELHINPLSSQINIVLQKILQPDFMPENIINVRPMEIIGLDEEAQEILVNIHYTTLDTEDDEKIFENLKLYLKSSFFNNNNIVLLNFLSSDFCMPETNILNWPKTFVGCFANFTEFCFTSAGVPVTRVCDGSYVEGAQWSSFEKCKILEHSTVTSSLMLTIYSPSDNLSTVYNMSERYQEFASLDVYLVAQKISEFLSYNISIIDTIGRIVTNLLKIDRNVMREAQIKSKATDKLLYLIDRISFVCEDFFEFYSDTFAVVSLSPQNLSGLAVIKNSDKFVITKLIDINLIENVTAIKNLESVIWLSPEYQKTLKTTEKITFWVYFNDVFFLQEENFHVDFIFGMVRSSYRNYFNEPVFIAQRVSPEGSKLEYCSFWNYSVNNRGYWKNFRHPQLIKQFLVCDILEGNNYAIVSRCTSMCKNVTDDLNDLFESNATASETIERLAKMSEKFIEFESIDLSYVEKILKKISTDKNVTLTHLAKTISNVQQVKRDVLLQSQKELKVTDNILTYVDTIIKSHNLQSMVQAVSDNCIILIFDRKDNVSGVALLNKSYSLEPLLLTSSVSIEEVIQRDNFDSAVLLSEKLQAQFVEETSFIVTIYFTDTLFNENCRKKQQIGNKIFGVVLPEIDELVEPISLLYRKNTENENHECVFWYYSSSISGFWKRDGIKKNLSNLVVCDFWHNTHLGYLIVDVLYSTPDVYLDIVTSVNSIISLVSLNLILLTAICFKQWRNNTGNRILLNFTFIIIVQIVVFYISIIVDQEKNYVSCIIVGALLHYSIISQFCWMFVIAILQFRRFVVVFDGPPKYVLLKACVCGWILPLLPVISVVSIDKESYVKTKNGLCYPSKLGLYLGVWLPISIIILINFVLFSITLYNIVCRRTESYGSSDVLYQWRLAVLLFFLLGFTWSFGFLAKLDFGLVFEYLFCITATLQGFILFLFFIVCNANTRQLYIAAFRRCCKRRL